MLSEHEDRLPPLGEGWHKVRITRADVQQVRIISESICLVIEMVVEASTSPDFQPGTACKRVLMLNTPSKYVTRPEVREIDFAVDDWVLRYILDAAHTAAERLDRMPGYRLSGEASIESDALILVQVKRGSDYCGRSGLRPPSRRGSWE